MTPSKRRMIDAETPSRHTNADTPSKQRSILKSTLKQEGTPKSLRKVLFSTPAKPGDHDLQDAPTKESPLTAALNADRSARRKSHKRLFEPQDEDESQVDDTGLEDALAREILDDAVESDQDMADDNITAVPGTPSKTPRPRGRPKGKKRQPSPIPQDMPSHELYFFQNRPGAVKTSTNTLPSNALLNHDDYFANINAYNDPHAADKQFLAGLHENGFDQWLFELEQGFNICIYGYGSKRDLLLDFADHLYQISDKKPTLVIVNGYSPNISVRDVLTTIAKHSLPSSVANKLPLQPQALLDALLPALTASSRSSPIYILVHSIDSPFFRKPLFQSTVSTLAAHPDICLVASADTPTFPLLWDISQRSSLRFLFHDTTTFAPYTAELDPVEEVNILLNRSGRRIGGKDGVAYVLRSLPENARNLFRILVAEQLALADSTFETHPESSDSESALGHSGDDMDLDHRNVTKPTRGRGRPPKKAPTPKVKTHKTSAFVGVEYRTLYHKAVEEFVCSSEMSFRTLLKEFHDHDIVESKKDGLGVERLAVPFGREDLEEMLQELV